MRTHQTLYLTCTFTLALLVPLLPFLLNGAPFIGDTWIHLDLAEDITATGRYSLSSYNERWPLVNHLLVFIMLIGGLNSLQASQVVPLLVGLASLSIYAVCRRLGLPRGASALSVLFLTFNPLYSYVTFAGAVMKETATYYLTMLMLLVATLALQQRTSKTRIALCTLLGLGIVLGHHFAGLIIFLFLWAPSGSGKTTLLKVSAGLLRPDSGRVMLLGKELYHLTPKERVAVRRDLTAFMFQEDLLIDTLNVMENVELPLIIERHPRKLRVKLVERALEAVDLKGMKTRRPMEVSGGERRRISLARCLVKRPKILFLDEPTSNLDTDTALTMLDIMKQLNGQGATIILSTHDPLIAKHVGNVTYIRDGTLR